MIFGEPISGIGSLIVCFSSRPLLRNRGRCWALLGGLLVFGVVFALNSALHSYLIVSYAKDDGVSLDVGFYYMSNAMGRLIGTLLSGWVYQAYGLEACLWISSLFVTIAAMISITLPRHTQA